MTLENGHSELFLVNVLGPQGTPGPGPRSANCRLRGNAFRAMAQQPPAALALGAAEVGALLPLLPHSSAVLRPADHPEFVCSDAPPFWSLAPSLKRVALPRRLL